MFRRTAAAALAAPLLLGLPACGTAPARLLAENPTLGVRTAATDELRALPAPARRYDVAVFAFQDQTGQHRPNNSFAEYSFAVTQGGAAILINALKDAGRGQWFYVLERNRLGDLFQERQIIRANRSEGVGPNGQPLPPLGPLRNAGIMVTGGIIGYDANVLTGGFGANFLGIGGNTEYRRDSVAVYLRAVSVLTGEVLVSVTTDKTIYSVGLQGQASRYVGFNRLLQIEGGVTTNEPRQLAVRQAIEKAVHALVVEAAEHGYFKFADEDKGREVIRSYLETRDGMVPDPAVAPATAMAGAPSASTAPVPTPAPAPAAPSAASATASTPPVPAAAAQAATPSPVPQRPADLIPPRPARPVEAATSAGTGPRDSRATDAGRPPGIAENGDRGGNGGMTKQQMARWATGDL